MGRGIHSYDSRFTWKESITEKKTTRNERTTISMALAAVIAVVVLKCLAVGLRVITSSSSVRNGRFFSCRLVSFSRRQRRRRVVARYPLFKLFAPVRSSLFSLFSILSASISSSFAFSSYARELRENGTSSFRFPRWSRRTEGRSVSPTRFPSRLNGIALERLGFRRTESF